MATKTFAPGTVIDSPWLNDVDQAVYEILGDGVNPATTKAAARTNLGVGLVANGGTGATTAQAAKTNLLIPPATQCLLGTNGVNLSLTRFGGSYLTINGVQEVIPAAGVTLAVAGAAASTRYFIYAFMNVGVMTLEFSVTVPVADTASGVLIKTGDVTRTLVGQARTTAGTAWANSATQRFVLSYYNRSNLSMGPKVLGTSAGIFSTGVYGVMPGSVSLLEFLVWDNDAFHFEFQGAATTNVACNARTMLAIDSANTDCYTETSMSTVGAVYPVNLSLSTDRAAGYHTVEVYGQQNVVCTVSYIGSGTPGLRCSIQGFVRG